MMCRLIVDCNKVGTSIQRDGDMDKIGADSIVMSTGRVRGSPAGEQLEACDTRRKKQG